jgi:hypothetical protein
MRTFSLREANELLPSVRALVDALMAGRERVLGLGPELWPAAEAAVHNGGSGVGGPVLSEVLGMRRTIATLRGLGVEVKDLNVGLIDFPARFRGREVYLCWRRGEERIAYWHEIDAGFAGRQPVIADQWD